MSHSCSSMEHVDLYLCNLVSVGFLFLSVFTVPSSTLVISKVTNDFSIIYLSYQIGGLISVITMKDILLFLVVYIYGSLLLLTGCYWLHTMYVNKVSLIVVLFVGLVVYGII